MFEVHLCQESKKSSNIRLGALGEKAKLAGSSFRIFGFTGLVQYVLPPASVALGLGV